MVVNLSNLNFSVLVVYGKGRNIDKLLWYMGERCINNDQIYRNIETLENSEISQKAGVGI